jgi:two-component sensor histidine kinase
LGEKDILLKELHHRVKNNLQVISSMLNLQAGARGGAEVSGEFVKAQNRIHALALLHEMLYQSGGFDRLDLGRYLRSIVSAVIGSCCSETEPPSYYLAIDRIEIGIDSAIPCGLIVNELVTNVVKHAFGAGRHGHFTVGALAQQLGGVMSIVREGGDARRNHAPGGSIGEGRGEATVYFRGLVD